MLNKQEKEAKEQESQNHANFTCVLCVNEQMWYITQQMAGEYCQSPIC